MIKKGKVAVVVVCSGVFHAVAQPSDMDLYLLIGQSNMAGRGRVEAQDRKTTERVFTLSKENVWVPAVDPIHFDKKQAGVGPGRTFGIMMAEHDSGKIIGLIPCAVGGTSIRKWVPGEDDQKTNTRPYDDMLVRLRLAQRSGTVKGILWHQGESDGKMGESGAYANALKELIQRVRAECGNPGIPFVIGQLGRFDGRSWDEGRRAVDAAHREVADQLAGCAFVSSDGLRDKGDLLHFDAASARELGRRFAEKIIGMQKENFGKVDKKER